MSDVQFDFKGKNFVVVGASSGLGRQIALELAESGAHVLAVARNETRLEELANASPLIHTAMLDVLTASADDWTVMFESFVHLHGKIHGGGYTAGITGVTPLKCYNKEMASAIFRTSFDGGIDFLQFAMKKKFSEEGAAFVVFSSVASYEGTKGLLFYASAKSAIQTAVRTIAKEIGHRGQRINSISPAWVETEMTDSYLETVGEKKENVQSGILGMGKSEDVSGVTLFLLSSRAKWITGQDFVVDGGYMCGAWN